MKKRLYGIVLLLLAACLIIAAAQSSRRKEPQPAETILRIALWDYDVVEYDRKIIAAFEKENPDIKVEVISYPAMYYNSSLKALLDSGERVDLFYVNQLDQLRAISVGDDILPLDALAERDGIDLDVYPYMDSMRKDGALLALPYRKDKFLLYYNRDLFEQTQLEVPTKITWSGFAELAEALTERTDDRIYGAYFQLNAERLPRMMRDGAWEWETVEPAAVERELEYFRSLEEKGCMPLFSLCESQGASQRSFQTGRYGMFVHGTWYLNYLKSDAEKGMFDFSWGAAMKPFWNAQESCEQTQLTPVCIHRNTAELEAAWKLLKYICGRKGADILADELIIPAYMDAEVTDRLSRNLREYHIDPDLVLSNFGAPRDSSDAQSSMKNEAEQLYGEALIGLVSPQQAAERIREMQCDTVQ